MDSESIIWFSHIPYIVAYCDNKAATTLLQTPSIMKWPNTLRLTFITSVNKLIKALSSCSMSTNITNLQTYLQKVYPNLLISTSSLSWAAKLSSSHIERRYINYRHGSYNCMIRIAIRLKFFVPRYISIDELFSHLNRDMNQMNHIGIVWFPIQFRFTRFCPHLHFPKIFPKMHISRSDTLPTCYLNMIRFMLHIIHIENEKNQQIEESHWMDICL